MNTADRQLLQLQDSADVTPINHEGDVLARCDIADGRVMKVRRSLTVTGTVGAAQIAAGGTASISGDIKGQQAGRYAITGDLECRSISGGTVIAQAGVRVGGDLEYGHVTCCGRLDVRGAIVGSDVAANGGVTCRTLGNLSGAPTIVEAGEGRTLRLLTDTVSPQIAAGRSQAAAKRVEIGPMFENLKSLSAKDREKATELLAEADEMDAEVSQLAAALERRKRLVSQQANPRVAVIETVYPGVRIRIGGAEAVVTSPISGPVTLTARVQGDRCEIIATDDASGVVSALPSNDRTSAKVA